MPTWRFGWGSGVPPGGLGGVGRPTQSFGSDREAHPEVREGSGGPRIDPQGVGSPTRRSVSGREAHPEVREGSKGQPGCSEAH